MALSIPLADIMAYRKVARAYFALLDVLCHNHAQVRSRALSRKASSAAGARSTAASIGMSWLMMGYRADGNADRDMQQSVRLPAASRAGASPHGRTARRRASPLLPPASAPRAPPQVVARCEPATFAFLVRSLDAGLKSLDVSISSQCAAAVDNLAGFFFKGCAAGEAPSPAAQVQKFLPYPSPSLTCSRAPIRPGPAGRPARR